MEAVVKWLLSLGQVHGIVLLGWLLFLTIGPYLFVRLERETARNTDIAVNVSKALTNLSDILDEREALQQLCERNIEVMTRLVTLVEERIPRK